jgi:hypothetical protein
MLTSALRANLKICQVLAKPFRQIAKPSANINKPHDRKKKKIGLPPNLKKMDVTQNLVEEA